MQLWQMLASFQKRPTTRSGPEGHIHDEDLERFALGSTNDAEKFRIEAHISACEKCRAVLMDAIAFARRLRDLRNGSDVVERRKEPRFDVTETAIVTVTHPAQFESVDGLVTDVSKSGICARVPRLIERGSQIRVRVENAVVFGTVRYSRPMLTKWYEIGIAIEQVVVAPDASTPGKTIPVGPPASDPFEILLVEDNPGDVKLTQLMLREIGIPHNLTVARDGEDALSVLYDPVHPRPHLILLDLNLPKVSGFEVLRRVRSEEPLRDLAVAVLSSSNAESDVEKADSLGVQAYFQKPADFAHYADLSIRVGALMAELAG